MNGLTEKKNLQDLAFLNRLLDYKSVNLQISININIQQSDMNKEEKSDDTHFLNLEKDSKNLDNKISDQTEFQVENFNIQKKNFNLWQFYDHQDLENFKEKTKKISIVNGDKRDESPSTFSLPKIFKIQSIKNQLQMEKIKKKKIQKLKIQKENKNFTKKEFIYFKKNIKNIFFSKLNTDTIFLNQGEERIFLKILNKKMKMNYKTIEKIQDYSQIDKINQYNGNKRLEEEFKFIFKRSIKYLKNSFKEKNPDIKKKNFNQEFAFFYFKELSDKMNIPLNYFTFEDSKSKRDKFKIKCHKTINSNYRNLILKSQKFTADFSNYLNDTILVEFQEEISYKLNNIFIKWQPLLSTNNISQIIYQIDTNQISLPWTMNELRKAISSVKINMNLI